MRERETKIIEELINSPIEDEQGCKSEAKAVLNKFFRSPLPARYQFFTPTYKSKVSKKEWLSEASGFYKSTKPSFKVIEVFLRGGALAYAKVQMTFTPFPNFHSSRTLHVGLIKEAGPYQPDPSKEYRINGATVPPWVSR